MVAVAPRVAPGGPLSELVSPDSECIVYVTAALDGPVADHECGHVCGLKHQTRNPAAIMRGRYTVDANEVNLLETTALAALPRGPWNE